MSRPALSATRSIEILDLLATFPEKGFTLSEIARATNINIASCHAVLIALTERGYLTRSANQRTFSLGPALIAVGQAALKSQPIVDRALELGEQMVADLNLAVLLSAEVGEEILAVVSLPNAAGRDAGMRVGERLPLVAPIGVPFLAWSSGAVVDAWLDRRESPLDSVMREEVKSDLRLTRQRGYQISLRGERGPSIGALINDLANSRQISDYKGEVAGVINTLTSYRSQPTQIVDNELYDVLLIAAPIFDHGGEAKFNFCLGGFSGPVSGAALVHHAERLMRACLDIMHIDRPLSPRKEYRVAR